ncbi:hypothetical protein KKF84_13360 [Myxococcota bacterium]|nr:hypothetical protein [Myxococcota bacterium]
MTKESLFFITLMISAGCKNNDNTVKPGSKPVSCAPCNRKNLESKAAHYFKTGLSSLDIYPVCTGTGANGAYRVYNKNMKSDGVVFIVTSSGIFLPGNSGHDFDSAFKACGLFEKASTSPALIAGLYVMLSPEKRRFGMVIRNPERFIDLKRKRNPTLPSALPTMNHYILDFWTRNISNDRLFHFQVVLKKNAPSELMSSKELKEY